MQHAQLRSTLVTFILANEKWLISIEIYIGINTKYKIRLQIGISAATWILLNIHQQKHDVSCFASLTPVVGTIAYWPILLPTGRLNCLLTDLIAGWPALLPTDRPCCRLTGIIADGPTLFPTDWPYCRLADLISGWPTLLPADRPHCRRTDLIADWPLKVDTRKFM